MRAFVIGLALLLAGCVGPPPPSHEEVAQALRDAQEALGPGGGVRARHLETNMGVALDLLVYQDGSRLWTSRAAGFGNFSNLEMFCSENRIVVWPRGMGGTSYEYANDDACPREIYVPIERMRQIPEFGDLFVGDTLLLPPVRTGLDPFEATAEDVVARRFDGRGYEARLHLEHDASFADYFVYLEGGRVVRVSLDAPDGVDMKVETTLNWGPRDPPPDYRGSTKL